MRYWLSPWPPTLPVQPPRTEDTLRRSVDGTLCVLAWTNDTVPDGVEAVNADTMRTLLDNDAWRNPDDI